MQSFLEEVVQEVCKDHDKLEQLIFILPSKRSGTFLRNAIAKTVKKTLFAPEIISIEGFIEKVSGLSTASHTQQVFELYKVYLEVAPDEKPVFHTFSKWANTLLQDFNEIDRHLVDAKKIFSNLADIQEISHWSPESKKTKMMVDYLDFWNLLEPLYSAFNQRLLDQNMGHQGLIYRQAFTNLSTYQSNAADKEHVFVGFNALNKAEERIIQKMISDPKNQIFWDIDTYFLDDPVHDAGYFIRKYLKDWNYFQGRDINGISSYYEAPKNIQIVGLPKKVSQAKFVGNLLLEQTDPNERTAVVLADETLLNPILNSIPEQVNGVNITMGYHLINTPLASLFEQLINLYINKETRGWYHKTILDLISHSSIQILLTEQETNYAQQISKTIVSENWSFAQSDQLIKICPDQTKNLELLFSDQIPSPRNFLDKCLQIINALREKIEALDNYLELEQLYRFYKLFNQLYELVGQYPFIDDLKSLQSLYHELLSHETLDFQGEPLVGLQIMGMLESRNLDFDTVILTSVNEGILPSGKSNNSFIPIDLKHTFGLPTYKEKDAVYTYHFYRLLQRAKNVCLLYNTEADVLEGGEKSRLIMQLQTDVNRIDDITETVISSDVLTAKNELECIVKDPHLTELIIAHAAKGFSPSSLSNYIRNPIEFYKRYLLRIEDFLEVEETIASNTFGTIIHDVLEEIYAPLIGQVLNEKQLQLIKPKIQGLVENQFKKTYPGGDMGSGKNLIAYNVIVKYIEKFIDTEIEMTQNHTIKILSLEEEFRINIEIPELDFPVVLKGKLDRIDEKDGLLRIIDYKTGKVESKNVEIVDWTEIVTDYDYSKAFQLLCYAFMFTEKNPVQKIESGIISFKNLSAGLLKFATKDKRGSRATKDFEINQETLANFQKQLKNLILEICDPSQPFLEKEV